MHYAFRWSLIGAIHCSPYFLRWCNDPGQSNIARIGTGGFDQTGNVSFSFYVGWALHCPKHFWKFPVEQPLLFHPNVTCRCSKTARKLFHQIAQILWMSSQRCQIWKHCSPASYFRLLSWECSRSPWMETAQGSLHSKWMCQCSQNRSHCGQDCLPQWTTFCLQVSDCVFDIVALAR